MKMCKWIMIQCLLFVIYFPLQTWALSYPVSISEDTEVVFLLDTSNSMNTHDSQRLAIDAIRQAVYSFPSNYKAGFVAYNTSIQAVIPTDAGLEQLEAQLGAIQYTGYTNAGEGLKQAVELFSDQEDVNQYIVMFSDGEIMMDTESATEASRIAFVEAANKAKELGAKVYIVAIGNELTSPQLHIFDAAEITDGAIYWEGQNNSLSQIMDKLINHRFQIFRKSVGVADGSGGIISVKFPGLGTGVTRIILTANHDIGNMTADFAASNGEIITGKRFSVVTLTDSVDNEANLNFQTLNVSEINAYLMTEIEAKLETEISYRSIEKSRTEEEIKNDVPPQYDHYADITIRASDLEEKNSNLWNHDYYKNLEVPFAINGDLFTDTIEDGALKVTMQIDEVEQLEISVDTSVFQEIYYLNQPEILSVSIPPDPEFVPAPKPDYRPLWALLGLLGAALVVIIYLWKKKSRTTVIYMAGSTPFTVPLKKPEAKSYPYSGKLNLYVVQTRDDRDVPPQTYRLFGRNSGMLTLSKILVSCGIKLENIGADEIAFYPGPDHSVIIMDQSDYCTVMRGAEIMKKGMGYSVYYNEKITVTLEDGVTELEIHYKNLKPLERAEF